MLLSRYALTRPKIQKYLSFLFSKLNFAVIEEGVLYLTVYGGLAGGRYSEGSFAVDIQDDLKNVSAVCLKGCDDTAVLYTR